MDRDTIIAILDKKGIEIREQVKNRVTNAIIALPGGEFFFPEEFRPSHYLVW